MYQHSPLLGLGETECMWVHGGVARDQCSNDCVMGPDPEMCYNIKLLQLLHFTGRNQITAIQQTKVS